MGQSQNEAPHHYSEVFVLAFRHSFKALFCGFLLTATLALPALAERPPLAELWFQTSAEYRALCYQTYKMAEFQLDRWSGLLEKRADGKAYLPGSSKPAAVVLDLDETVIDNSGYQAYCAKVDTGYSSKTWDAWVDFQGINKNAGPALPGAPEFLAKAEAMGVTPIYISNRLKGQEEATIKVLARNGINVENIDDRLALRYPPDAETDHENSVIKKIGIAADSAQALTITKGEGHKEARRLEASKKFDVIAYFGDQLGDFNAYIAPAKITASSFKGRKDKANEYKSYWGTTWFMLPNPLYGGWGPGSGVPASQSERALEDYGFSDYLRTQKLLPLLKHSRAK